MADARDALRLALMFPTATAAASAFEVSGKGFAWFWQEKVEGVPGRVERRDVLVVRTANEEEKQLLLAADPARFFTIPHYNGYPAVHVRLAAVDADELTELLEDAWRTRAPKKVLKEGDAAR